MRQVVLYTKEGCHLCEVAKATIMGLRREVDFTLREIDITTDPELFDEHRYDIPVVEVDGLRAFKHRVDARALLQRLRT